MLVNFLDPCPTCGGEGLEYPTPDFSESHPLPAPCPSCVGGRVVSESVIEDMKDAALLTLYPTKANLREPGWIQDRFRSVARAVARVVLEHMEDSK